MQRNAQPTPSEGFTRSEREIMRILLRQHIGWAQRQSPSEAIVEKQSAAIGALAKLEALDAR